MRPLTVIPIALFAAVTGGCHRGEPTPPARDAGPPATVKTAPIAEQTYTLTEDVTGTVRAKTRAVIEARASGRVRALGVTLGQGVAEGEVLAEIDAEEIQTRLDQATAALDQAARDERRLATLLQTGATTQREFDAAKARLDAANAAVREAETMLGYTKVTAPFAGVITRKLADVGDLAGPGRGLVELEDPKQLRVEAGVPESLAPALQLGQRLAVIPAAGGEIEAAVAEIAPAADPNSRTFPVKLDLPADTGLRAGQFARVRLPVRDAQGIFVPGDAVVRRGQIDVVFIAEGDAARLRLVRLGAEREGLGVQVLSGVEPGELLVLTNAAALRDGQPIVKE